MEFGDTLPLFRRIILYLKSVVVRGTSKVRNPIVTDFKFVTACNECKRILKKARSLFAKRMRHRIVSHKGGLLAALEECTEQE